MENRIDGEEKITISCMKEVIAAWQIFYKRALTLSTET